MNDSDDAFATKAGDLLPLFDLAGLLLAGTFSRVVHADLIASAAALPGSDNDLQRLSWVAAALAPFILFEPRFAALAGAGDSASLSRSFARRLLTFLGVTAAIAFAGRWLEGAPPGWLETWLCTTLLFTASSRMLLARILHRHAGAPEPPAAIVAQVGDWLPVTVLADRPIKRWSAVFKSGGDFLMAGLITLLLLPVLAIIALAIRLDSPGPLLFTQRRHGLNNSEFDIYKFRTMRSAPVTAGAALQQTVRGDPRVTRVGRFLRKWSLDELPQVFNVLEGSMALVGPRPHAVNMRTEQRLGHEITDTYPHRHRVKPGITGWSQVNGARGATDTVEQLQRRVTLDLFYVEHWSPLLDLKILTLTFREVLRATNAY
jgi:lipopolysaccharide/colanic/teichoic acid biosynthesis glycosyltransferase